MNSGENSFAPPMPQTREGHGNLRAFALPLGVAVFASYLLFALLPRARALTTALFYVSLALALWRGHLLERRWGYGSGRRRFPGTLFLGITWAVLGWSLLWAGLLIAFAHARTWHWLGGWRDGPILLTLTLGLFHLAQGVRLRVGRSVCVGGVLCLLGVLIPGVQALREHINLATAFLVGGTLILSGYARQGNLRRQDRTPRASEKEG